MSVLMVESKFRSGDGINGVYYAKWCDDAKKPKAILQIAHGMCEYIARYKGFAEFMTQNGYVVFGNDHLGHGHTAKSDSELGYFAKKDGYRLLVSDMHKLTEIAKEEYPGLPLILLGHSMGSFLARLWAATYPKEADAFIFMGTSGANPLGAVGIFLVNVISIFKGERHRSNFINFMSFGSYTKKLNDVRTPYDWITRDRDVVNTYAADRWCTYVFTLSGFRDLFKALGAVSGKEWPKSLDKEKPVLLISGCDDPVGSCTKGVRQVYDKLEGAGLKDVTLKLYEGMRHEVLNEIGKGEVYQDVLAWSDAAVKVEKK